MTRPAAPAAALAALLALAAPAALAGPAATDDATPVFTSTQNQPGIALGGLGTGAVVGGTVAIALALIEDNDSGSH